MWLVVAWLAVNRNRISWSVASQRGLHSSVLQQSSVGHLIDDLLVTSYCWSSLNEFCQSTTQPLDFWLRVGALKKAWGICNAYQHGSTHWC
jgi:hypothetical protein